MAHGSRYETLNDCVFRVHGPDDVALQLRREMLLYSLEKVLISCKGARQENLLQVRMMESQSCLFTSKSSRKASHLRHRALSHDRRDLFADEIQDASDNRVKAEEDLLVVEYHVALLDASLGIIVLDVDVTGPQVSAIAEVVFDTFVEIYYALDIYPSSDLGTFGQSHLADALTQDVAEVAVKSSRSRVRLVSQRHTRRRGDLSPARVARPRCTQFHHQRRLVCYLEGGEVGRGTTHLRNHQHVAFLYTKQSCVQTMVYDCHRFPEHLNFLR